MATFNKFNCFVQDAGRAIHNLNSDSLKVMLTNTVPVATNAIKADITEIAAGGGYTAGGNAIASPAFTQSSGTAKLTGNATTFTPVGGAMATFRYAVLYNSSTANGNLIGWWDSGSAITLNSFGGDTWTIGKDGAGANWDSTTPILSVA